MTPAEVAAFLRNYNVWRRGNLDDQPMPDPRQIGEAIDAAVEMIGRLEATEKERDELRAKIEAMEKQEPVAHVWRCDNGHIHGSCESELLMGQQLYALPGAQPQLNEIKIALQRALELGKRQTWTGARKHRSWEDQREEHQCWNKVWSLLGAQGEEK